MKKCKHEWHFIESKLIAKGELDRIFRTPKLHAVFICRKCGETDTVKAKE